MENERDQLPSHRWTPECVDVAGTYLNRHGVRQRREPPNHEKDNNKDHCLTCFVRAGGHGIGSDGGEGSLCAVLGSDRFLLIFHGFQCFELLGMFRAFVVGRSLALQRRTQWTMQSGSFLNWHSLYYHKYRLSFNNRYHSCLMLDRDVLKMMRIKQWELNSKRQKEEISSCFS